MPSSGTRNPPGVSGGFACLYPLFGTLGYVADLPKGNTDRTSGDTNLVSVTVGKIQWKVGSDWNYLPSIDQLMAAAAAVQARLDAAWRRRVDRGTASGAQRLTSSTGPAGTESRTEPASRKGRA